MKLHTIFVQIENGKHIQQRKKERMNRKQETM